MTQDCKETRDNYWLIVDKTISADSLKTFNNHIKSCADCKQYIRENDEILGELNSLPLSDLDENVYINMLTGLKKEKIWLPSLSFLKKKENYPGKYFRYAFAVAVVVVTIALVFIFNSKKEWSEIGKPVISLDWKAEKIKNNIQKIDSSLIIIKTKTIKKNIFQNDPWKSDVYLLARDIERMQTELNKSTL